MTAKEIAEHIVLSGCHLPANEVERMILRHMEARLKDADLQLSELSATVMRECTRCKDGKIIHTTASADAKTLVHSEPCPCCSTARFIHITNDSCRQQTQKDWWGWGWKELSGKTSEQLEIQAKKVATTYNGSLSQERVIELLLKGKR